MSYVNCTKGTSVRLSSNFSSNEFDCHGSGCCNTTIINEDLVRYLQKIREHFGAVVTITSGYRCPAHNKNVGGATKSKHCGDAADIVVSGIAPREVAKYAESIGIKGIGLYETNADGHFVHIDTRTTKAFWYGQAQKYRSTFGGTQTNDTTSNTVSNILRRGATGAKVVELQTNLISLGYSCGISGADGKYGAATVTAVMRFQKANGLKDDGIAGPLTLSKIQEVLTLSPIGKICVTASALNVRAGAGTNYAATTVIKKGTVCELLEEKNGWARIKSPAGWVSMQYVEMVK